MLSFQDFFTAGAGVWRTERTSHSVLTGEVKRSFTEFRADTLNSSEKQRILTGSSDQESEQSFSGIQIAIDRLLQNPLAWFGFTIAFATRSETETRIDPILNWAGKDAHPTSATILVRLPLPNPFQAQILTRSPPPPNSTLKIAQ